MSLDRIEAREARAADGAAVDDGAGNGTAPLRPAPSASDSSPDIAELRRLRDALDHPRYPSIEREDRSVVVTSTVRALLSQAERAGELERENELLKLLICGGEDAPGYAATLTLQQVTKVHQDTEGARRDERYTLARDLRHWREECGKLHSRQATLTAELTEARANLNKAWRAVDALGGTFPPDQAEYGRGYSEALDLACAEIEKLGGVPS